jgi:hypothetical protein
MPMTIAGTVPQPTWAFHHPKIGAVSAKLWSRVADAWISGVTVPAEVQVRHDERRDHQERADGDRHRLPATNPHAGQPIARLARAV